MTKLTPRLNLIANEILPGETMADIGTDHGFLPLYLWEQKICPKVIMADISKGSLQKARDNCKTAYPDVDFDLRLGSGIEVLETGEVDVVAIAGMGGLLMTEILGVDLNIGMDGSDVKFIRRGYANAASLKGLIHVDLYLVMRRYMTLERYTLERVYYELFGEEKIDVPGDRIYEFWDNGGKELKNLFKYSLDDVVSTLKIAQETLPLNLELTRIVGQPFVDVTRMATGQQAEWYLVRKAYEVDEVVPNKPNMTMKNIKERGSNSGGYVKEPEIGLHENLVQFDFKSLYPTLIISKNISPDVLVKDNSSYNAKFEDFEDYETGYDEIDNLKEEELSSEIDNDDEYYISPEHFFKFKKEPQGFIPSALEDILNERFSVKNRMKATDDPILRKSLDVQQQALKRLANTMYGVYGFLRFRWYSFECAQSITAWGRQHIKKAMKEAEDYGFKAIYADTDGFYAKYVPEMKKE